MKINTIIHGLKSNIVEKRHKATVVTSIIQGEKTFLQKSAYLQELKIKARKARLFNGIGIIF